MVYDVTIVGKASKVAGQLISFRIKGSDATYEGMVQYAGTMHGLIDLTVKIRSGNGIFKGGQSVFMVLDPKLGYGVVSYQTRYVEMHARFTKITPIKAETSEQPQLASNPQPSSQDDCLWGV